MHSLEIIEIRLIKSIVSLLPFYLPIAELLLLIAKFTFTAFVIKKMLLHSTDFISFGSSFHEEPKLI